MSRKFWILLSMDFSVDGASPLASSFARLAPPRAIASSDLAPLAHPLFRFLSFFSLPVYRNKYHLETHLRKSSGKGGRGSRGGAALSASQPAGVTAGGGDASFGRHFERQHFFCSFFCASMSF